MQLLPAAASVEYGTEAGYLPPNSRRDEDTVPVFSCWLRGDARARPSFDFGAEDRHAWHRDAGVEATRVESTAKKTAAKESESIGALGRGTPKRGAKFLAKALL